tara:strand:- start:230 stop:2248 length:2019 start_codon:yes stop_codon:yes gene_type:complete
MTQAATVEVKLTVNKGNLESGMRRAETVTKKTSSNIVKAQDKVSKSSNRIQEGFRRASQSIAAIQGPLGPVAGRITSLGTIIGGVGLKLALLTVGISAFIFATKQVVGVVSNAERQFNKLNAILRATGFAAQLSLEEIETLSQEIGIGTLASTQKVRDAAGILLTFKSITGDTFREALRLTQDLAEVGFGDVKQGAIQLGKALEEPIVGLGALRRVGVSFTDAQKDLIKSLANTGRIAEAQDIILEALNKQVGGAGVKAADGLAGALDTLSERFTIFFEQHRVGRAVVDFLTAAMNRLADAMKNTLTDVESLNTEMQVANRLLIVRELIAKRMAELEPLTLTGDFNVMDDRELKKLLEQESLLLSRQRVLEAIAKDNEETAKKEEELYGAQKIKKVTEKTAVEKKALEVIKQINVQRELEKKNLFATRKEKELNNQLEKIFAQIRKEVPDEKLQQEAIRKARAEHTETLKNQIDEMDKLRKVSTAIQEVTGVLNRQFDQLSESLAKAFVTGKTEALNFKAVLQSLAVDLVKTILNLVIFNQLKEGINVIGGKIGKTILGSISGPQMQTIDSSLGSNATGGSVQNNMPRLVGERGPELFVPNQAGRVIPSSLTPNAMGGGGSIVVNQSLNFATGIQNTVRAEIISMMPQIQNQTVSAVAEARMRGGKFAKAFS